MSRHGLEIGCLVHFAGREAGRRATGAAYRVEQLLRLGDGATLYKIRSEAEPFDRVVGEHDVKRAFSTQGA